jgi:hypothetical protein
MYRAALRSSAPLRPLALTLHLDLLRTAATGLVNAFGSVPPPLVAGAAGSFGHRLYLNDAVLEHVALVGPARRRLVSAGYRREVDRLAGTAAEALAWADSPATLPDERLDAALGVVHDEVAWAWAVAATGAVLDDGVDGLVGGLLDALFIRGVNGSPFGDDTVGGVEGSPGRPPLRRSGSAGGAPRGQRRTWRALAERNADALGAALVELVAERGRRLAAAGTIPSAAAIVHLTWAELLQPPPADQIAAHIDSRRREHDRLAGLWLPGTLAGAGPSPLPTTTDRSAS